MVRAGHVNILVAFYNPQSNSEAAGSLKNSRKNLLKHTLEASDSCNHKEP